MIKKVGIVGYSAFGQLMEKHLQDFCAVEIFKRGDLQELKENNQEQIQRLQTLDHIIISVTLESFEEVCGVLSKHIASNTVVTDVCSVKVSPVEMMQKHFLNNEIVATHPVFGPQSAAAGLENLKIVTHNVSASTESYLEIKDFLQHKLKLLIIEMTPAEHDHEMAYVQGLSHFIAQALERMNIPDSPVATYSYRQLLKLRELIGKDSFELFKTIENGNPETQKIRDKFREELSNLESILLQK